MILIFTERNDSSIDSIILLLNKKKEPVIKITPNSQVTFSHEIGTDLFAIKTLHINETFIHFNEIKGVWVYGIYIQSPILDNSKNSVVEQIEQHLKLDFYSIVKFLLSKLQNVPNYLGSHDCNSIHFNKLEVLTLAEEIGFKIPKTYLVNNQHQLKNIHSQATNGLITKSLDNPITINTSNQFYNGQRTELIDLTILESKDEYFFTSFVQMNVEKKFEIRAFVLDSNIFSAAIFSQGNSKTKIDFRNFQKDNSIRYVPYAIDDEVKFKILKLSNKLQTNCCSFDFILNDKDEFIFLEVNEFGQFDFISKKCNFQLEDKISNFLCK